MKIAIAGTGYVGLSLAVLLAQNNEVTAVDVVPEKVDKINRRISPIQDEYIERYLAEKPLKLTATTDAEKAYGEADFVVIGSMGVQGARKTKPQLGESAMVTGLGILGQFAAQALRCSGGLPVIAVDFDEHRRKVALELGADEALSPADPRFVDRVRELTRGRMINCNVEVTGSSAALTQALTVAAWEGRIALTGCTRVSDVPIDFYQMVHRPGVQLIGAHNFVRPHADSYPGYWTRHDDFAAIMDMIDHGRMRVGPIISEVVPVDRAKEIYQRLIDCPTAPLGIAFDWHK